MVIPSCTEQQVTWSQGGCDARCWVEFRLNQQAIPAVTASRNYRRCFFGLRSLCNVSTAEGRARWAIGGDQRRALLSVAA